MIDAGGAVPAAWMAAPVVTVDDAAVEQPAEVVAALHRAWAERTPVVVELAVDPATFRAPATIDAEPWRLDPDAEPMGDRLHFLVWANTYDARGGTPIWWWGRKAARLGATETAAGEADVVLADGTHAWIDGGPRQPLAPEAVGGHGVVHRESVELGRLASAPPPVPPSADLAADQLAAVAHERGPARVIAPAGSGKTRVLTERLRHLLGDRGWERESVLAVAYNKEAQLELERRCEAFRPRVRTLNSLGLWVLESACRQGRAWQGIAPDQDGLKISVNLSARQLDQPDLVDRIAAILEQTGLPPCRLVLEMTEGVLMENTDSTLQILNQIRNLGIRLAIDDFGTGYSSLSYLHQFPVDILKIDRSFVQDLAAGRDTALVRSIVQLAQSLGLETVAEGIEREQELDLLRLLGCTTGQGYYFSRPVPAATLSQILLRQRLERVLVPS